MYCSLRNFLRLAYFRTQSPMLRSNLRIHLLHCCLGCLRNELRFAHVCVNLISHSGNFLVHVKLHIQQLLLHHAHFLGEC